MFFMRQNIYCKLTRMNSGSGFRFITWGIFVSLMIELILIVLFLLVGADSTALALLLIALVSVGLLALVLWRVFKKACNQL